MDATGELIEPFLAKPPSPFHTLFANDTAGFVLKRADQARWEGENTKSMIDQSEAIAGLYYFQNNHLSNDMIEKCLPRDIATNEYMVLAARLMNVATQWLNHQLGMPDKTQSLRLGSWLSSFVWSVVSIHDHFCFLRNLELRVYNSVQHPDRPDYIQTLWNTYHTSKRRWISCLERSLAKCKAGDLSEYGYMDGVDEIRKKGVLAEWEKRLSLQLEKLENFLLPPDIPGKSVQKPWPFYNGLSEDEQRQFWSRRINENHMASFYAPLLPWISMEANASDPQIRKLMTTTIIETARALWTNFISPQLGNYSYSRQHHPHASLYPAAPINYNTVIYTLRSVPLYLKKQMPGFDTGLERMAVHGPARAEPASMPKIEPEQEAETEATPSQLSAPSEVSKRSDSHFDAISTGQNNTKETTPAEATTPGRKRKASDELDEPWMEWLNM